jgi:hypothetical protein
MGLLDRLFRANRPPGDGMPMLPAGERVTAWGTTADGQTVVATQLALWLPTGEGHRRLPWQDVHKAAWSEGTMTITPGVEVEPGVVADGTVARLRLAEPRDMPGEVRARVTRSVAYSSHQPLTGLGGGVRVVARRVPGEDGLTWVLRFDEGVDRSDTAVRQAAERVLDEARIQIETRT